jgi:hypothetical protein
MSKEVAMRSILKSRLGRASTTFAIAGLAAGLAIVTAGASAQARDYGHESHAGHSGYGHAASHYMGGGGGARYHDGYSHGGYDHGGGYYHGGYYGYGPRYGYYAPPVVAYPPAYYGPAYPAWPSLNLNIPLG